MGTCIDVGFKFRRFPWTCEAAWPKLPELCQRALNASHMVTTKSNELTVMCATVDLDADRLLDVPFKTVVTSVGLASPPCAAYLDKVAVLAQQCAGVVGSPLVKFLDRFGKRFGQNQVFGEEFFTALADLKSSQTDPWTFLKVALVATNLSAPDIYE